MVLRILAPLLLLVQALPAQPPQRTFPEVVRADVAATLARLAPQGVNEATLVRLERELGTPGWLLPLLVGFFPEQQKGVLAVALAGRLRDADRALLEVGIVRAARSDRAFVMQAARSLGRLTPEEELGARSRAWRGDGSLALRLAGILATPIELEDLKHLARTNLLSTEGEEALLAAERLLERPDLGAPLLLAAARMGLSGPARTTALLALLDGPESALPGAVELVAGDPALVKLAERRRFAVPRWRAILAELLSLPASPGVDRWLGRLMGVSGPGARKGVLPQLVTDPDLRPLLIAAARRRPLAGTGKQATPWQLPQEALLLPDVEHVLALARQARPAHVSFLLTNLDRVPWPERARVAASLVKVGHPEGMRILDRASHHAEASVRRAVAGVLLSAGLDAPDLQARLLQDADPGVRAVALRAVNRSGGALQAGEALRLLAEAEGWQAEQVLAALARGSGDALAEDTLIDALAAGAVMDPGTGARWLFARPALRSPAILRPFLSHAEPLVRARAVEAWARAAVREGLPARIAIKGLDGPVKDEEPLVRQQAARALGRLRSDLARASLATLARDPHWLVREEVLLSLAEQDNYHVLPLLRRALEDPHAWVVNAARCALFSHGRLDVVLPLLEDIDDVVIGPRTRRYLARRIKARCRDRQDYVQALDREHPGWDRRH